MTDKFRKISLNCASRIATFLSNFNLKKGKGGRPLPLVPMIYTDCKAGIRKEGESLKNGDEENQFFSNFYIAVTKSIDLIGHSIGFHMAYRHWKCGYNCKWNGPVSDITYQKNPRMIAEYIGDDVNVGFN